MLKQYLILLSTLALVTASALSQAETESQWRARALGLQAHVDDPVPLSRATFVGTHNSYSNTAEGYPHGIINHDKNITDQLNGGARLINFDIWKDIFNANVQLCHGSCSGSDTQFETALSTLKTWLDANPNEVVFLMIEDKLLFEGDYTLAVGDINNTVQSKLYHPGGHCPLLDIGNLSKRDILDAGKQLVIVYPDSQYGGDCANGGAGNSGWKGKVVKANFEIYGVGSTDNHVNYINSCENDATRPSDKWVLAVEDRMADKTSPAHHLLDATELNNMTNKCNVAITGLDMLIHRDRRDSLIWSWSKTGQQPDNTGGNQDCAVQNYGSELQKWNDDSCSATHNYACHDSATNTWKVTTAADIWDPLRAEFACTSEFGTNFTFGVPRNAGQNGRLHTANTGNVSVWLNYSDSETEATWKSTDDARKLLMDAKSSSFIRLLLSTD